MSSHNGLMLNARQPSWWQDKGPAMNHGAKTTMQAGKLTHETKDRPPTIPLE